MNFKFLRTMGCIALGSSFIASAQEATLQNVLLNKAVIEVAGKPAADSEGPENLIDGDLKTKYCIIQSNPFVVIDAQGYYQFSSFKFHDCKTNEDEENASAYKLELSMDGKTWQTVAEATDVAAIDLKEINIDAPVKARYVRLSPTYRNCARIWEFEGFGTDATTLSATLQTEKLQLDINADGKIILNYTIDGKKSEDFTITTETSKTDIIEIGTVTDENGAVSIPVKGIAKGAVTVTVTIINAGEVATFSVPVRVTSDIPASDADAVEISNWKTDIVAESLNSETFSGIKSGWYDYIGFYTAAVEAEGALCNEDGIVETASGNIYKIPFGEKNATSVDEYDPAELTLTTPMATENVNLLVFARSYDGITLNSSIIYEDGSESDETGYKLSHWAYYDGELDGTEALTGIGTILNSLYDGVSVEEEKNIRFYEISLPADKAKKVKAISLSTKGGEYNDEIFAVGVNAKEAKMSGTIDIESNNTDKVAVAYYLLNGQKVDNVSNGLYIVRYSDGTSAKIYIK